MVRISFVILFLLLTRTGMAQYPQRIDFNRGWKFLPGHDSLASRPGYNDAGWRNLDLPHDWSIESDFIRDAAATNQGGSLPGGIGWYRKSFVLPAGTRDGNVSLDFDGVYQNSEVWINGHYLGKRPNGYMPFSYTLTDYLLPPPAQNLVAVKVDNSQQPNSRWYTGSGIYRDVTLNIRHRVAFDPAQLFIQTREGDGGKALVEVSGSIGFNKEDQPARLEYQAEIYDPSGRLVSVSKDFIRTDVPAPVRFQLTGTVHRPALWSPYQPSLYTLKLKLFRQGKLLDRVALRFGIRSFSFDAEKGFSLNGKHLLLKGVCMHHDLGALGAAFNIQAARRQLKILKEMGCNAIRFSHNPPASAMLDLCDEMGFLVIDEAFDGWRKKKNKYDYHLYFDDWHERDLEAMVLRDRNHPSVIAWSIGNENREQFDSSGTEWVKKLTGIVKKLDPTRPVTAALTETVPEKNFISKAGALDILGFNYKYYDYPFLPQRFPGMPLIATETASALETRAVYDFPGDSIRIWPPDYKAQDTFSAGNPDYTASAYDNTHAYWGGTHEKTWLAVKRHPFMAGIFVWSGFDFLGEPLPYPKFPARSSYYGIVDLAGFPKDVYYMYQSEWSDKKVLHVFPHWNWKKGEMVDVWAYYNHADEVELFLNGRSAGKRSKNDSALHVSWRLPFEPGQIRVVSRLKGKTVLTRTIQTAGAAYRLELKADRTIMKTGGKDLVFVRARIVDRNGILVPEASQPIQFSVTGNAEIAGTDNGYQADTLSLQSHSRQAWKGQALLILRPGSKKGNITLQATAPGIRPAVLSLSSID